MLKILINMMKWTFSRFGVIYVIVFVFCLIFVDLKTLDMRIKVRHLNSAIPDFIPMINFSRNPDQNQGVDWAPYKNYFELILRFMPDDVVAQELLGFVDYYSGQQEKSVALFKSASSFHEQSLFLSNYNLGVITYKKGMYPQAVEHLLKAIESNPQLTLLIMQNSTIYRQIFASPAFGYSLENEMADAQSDAYILLLSSLHALGQYDKMWVIATHAMARGDLHKRGAFYYYAGLGLLGLNQTEKAFLFFQKSLSIEKNNPDVYFYIADIYQKTGQESQARNALAISYALHQKNDERFPYDQKVNLRFF